MASLALYPPIVDSYSPAFIAGENAKCRVFFSLSSFNSVNDFETVQATVVRQESGLSVVNDKEDSNGHYRKTGIILNLTPVAVSGKDNLYYVDILNSDLKSVEKGYTGWIPGWIYKIQLRLSMIAYDGSGDDQAAWLNLNGSKFSEWSTVNVTKAIGQETVVIYNFNFEGVSTEEITYLTELNFYGYYKNEDSSELLANYRIQTELEDSGVIQAKNDKDSLQYFSYTFKKDYQLHTPYTITFTYETINKYTNTYVLTFVLEDAGIPFSDAKALTYEEDTALMEDITTPALEQDDGGILIKLHSENEVLYVGSICVRRADSKSNFTEWTDVKIINLKNQKINDIEPFYDLTIESGIFYKYAVQFIDTNGYRSAMNKNTTVSMREFEYSFLVGKGGKQLRLTYNNEMNNFKITVGEGKTDTIGGQYAFFSRNGDTYYKAFPITGLISFNMDENHLFTSRAELFGENLTKYNNYNKDHEITMYDVIYERFFRDAVSKFLYDGEYKLFKSPTEGNLIVRLMDINFSPNKTTNRMIYSFSSNAYEAADPTMENYLKYGFYDLASFDKEVFDEVESHSTKSTFTVLPESDLVQLLTDQLRSIVEIAGVTYSKEVVNISNVILSFRSEKLHFRNNYGQFVTGHPIEVNGNLIGIYDDIYDLSSYITFEPSKDTLKLIGDITLTPEEQHDIIVDVYCNYDTVNKVYQTSGETGEISRNYTKVTGQIDDTFNADADIYEMISDRYDFDSGVTTIELYSLKKIIIEAPQYATFSINEEEITIGETGLYISPADNESTFTSLEYLGMKDAGTGIIAPTASAALITYQGIIIKKVLKES